MRRLTRRQRIAALVLAGVAACLITLDLGGSGLRPAHSGVRGALGALYRGSDAVLGPVRRFAQGLPSAGSATATIARLRHENAVLRGELAASTADRATQRQLAALQRSADRRGERIVPARVIALGPGQGFDWTVTLDVGTSSGIRVDQSVTDGDGLVGRVLYADPSSAVVLLCADPGSGVGVRDVRTGQVGIATGNGSAGFTFVPLDPAAAVQVGDRLVTGPAGATSFVAGLSVGTVSSVATAADRTTTRADVTPTAPATGLDLVGVILAGGQPATRAPLSPARSQPVAQAGH